jgi:hypothetical protein
MTKRPDLDELDVPEWAELVLDKVGGATAVHRPSETAAAIHGQSAGN